MAIFRGTGGASQTSTEATIQTVTAQALLAEEYAGDALAAKTAAESAQSAAEAAAEAAQVVTGNTDNINTVADNTTNITTVATNINNVNTVAGINTDVTAVATAASDIPTVAGIAANVTTVAGVSSNVTTVAGISTNVTTVAGISSDVTTVAGVTTDLANVTANLTDIQNASTNAANAAAAYDSFDDRYLGAKVSAPTTDNDGDALVTGALYYNSSAGQLYVWDGSAWDEAAFNATGAVTSFNTRVGAVTLSSADVTTALGYTPISDSATNLTLSGYLRGPASFTIDPAAHGDNTGTVVIAGNLQVDGTTTTINSTTMTVDDLNVVVASGAADATAADGAGLTIDGASISLSYDHANTRMDLNAPLKTTGLTVGSVAYPSTDGTDGQVLTTDGAGNVAFETIEAGVSTGKAIAMAIVFGG